MNVLEGRTALVTGASSGIGADLARDLIELDVVAPVHLTKLFLPGMLARDFGYVLQVSSIGAFLPTPGYATYSAAKSFLLSFSEAIDYELRKTKLRVCALCPGVTRTEFFEVAGQRMSLFQRLTLMPSAAVARVGIDALLAGRRSKIAGRLNALSMAASVRLTPRRAATALANLLMRYGAR